MKNKMMIDLKQFMKDKNVNGKKIIQVTRAAILQYEKDNLIESDEQQQIAIIQNQIKKLREALDYAIKANRIDLIESNKEQIKILENYLPKQLTDDELQKEITNMINTFSDKPNIKMMGQLVKQAKDLLGSNCSGLRISQEIKKQLLI